MLLRPAMAGRDRRSQRGRWYQPPMRQSGL